MIKDTVVSILVTLSWITYSGESQPPCHEQPYEEGPGDEKLRPPISNPVSEPLGADLQALLKLSDDYSPSQQLDCNLLRRP